MSRPISRRTLLKGVAGAGALVALGHAGGAAASPGVPAVASKPAHLQVSAWVWQFDRDGEPDVLRHEAARRGMRVIVKTHDGLDWMAKWDTSAAAVSGPDQLRRLRAHFAGAGVHLDAWCVPTGEDPIAEAQMCSQVIDAGVERLYLDLEAGDGRNYWHGTHTDAVRFGEELRRLQPRADLIVAPDARPWQVARVPIAEFAGFCDGIAPQSYWKLFDTESNHRRLSEAGYHTGPEGVTPELMLDVTMRTFEAFRRKLVPIGDGEAGPEQWTRFVQAAGSRGVDAVSVWRFGSTGMDVWDSIAAPRRPAAADVLDSARKVFRRWRRAGLRPRS